LLKELSNLLENLLHGGLPGVAGDLPRKDSWVNSSMCHLAAG
jgi:hypothetical protein